MLDALRGLAALVVVHHARSLFGSVGRDLAV